MSVTPSTDPLAGTPKTPGCSCFRVVFLVGGETESTRQSIEEVCRLQGVTPVAVLVDTAKPNLSRRFRNLRRNVRVSGAGYFVSRLTGAIRSRLEAAAVAVVPLAEVEALLRRAFPERIFSLEELGAKYGFRVKRVGNLNSAQAIAALGACRATLGIVLGTRVLKKPTFSVPELGCINLHKGKLPEFRGMPPGFWELYEGAETAGVTVHFVDDGLDTGDIVRSAEILIHPKETPESLRTKLDFEGSRVLSEAVASLRDGRAVRRSQPSWSGRPKTKPTLREKAELIRRRPYLRQHGSDLKAIFKTALYLFLLRTGIYEFVRRKRAKESRAAIVLYHRANDVSVDPLTVSTRVLAEHLVVLRHYYRVISSDALIGALERHEAIPPGAVLIHFDDCYRDVATKAAPLLRAAGAPAAMFVSSGFIDTDRVFEHDAERYPHRFENLRCADFAQLLESNFEIGAHTVNHVDLGKTPPDVARMEIMESRAALKEITGLEIDMFSFPFGRRENCQPAVVDIIGNAGFRALFSAYGGFVSNRTECLDIPRMGASGEHRGLDLMMELAGISLRDLFRRSHR
jgi:peptidoglycan/xylan/chitin deacetylase (PgdA/CDA1 family)